MAGKDIRANAKIAAEGLDALATSIERVGAASVGAITSGPGGDTPPGAALERVNAPAPNAVDGTQGERGGDGSRASTLERVNDPDPTGVSAGPGGVREPGVTAAELRRVVREENERFMAQVRQEDAAQDRENRRREEERDRRRELAEQRNRPANGIAPGVFIDSTLLL